MKPVGQMPIRPGALPGVSSQGVKERPILFKAEMVRAILAGTKTQTRRVAKVLEVTIVGKEIIHAEPVDCPYKVGDHLWVKETFFPNSDSWVAYKDGSQKFAKDGAYYPGNGRFLGNVKWKPSIFMPRWASRITLEIAGVRVERLQAISETDAVAEGVAVDDARHDYEKLWESINGKGSWKKNPWVWVIEFRRIEP